MKTSSRGNRTRGDAGKSRAAFSLIELLVVIAIVVITGVLLVPAAVQQDLAQGEQVVCANHWRQGFMIAYAFYDDNGYWPISLDYIHFPPHWWFQALFPNVGEGSWTWGPLKEGTKFENDPRILDCPSNADMWPAGWAYWTPVNAAPNMVQSPDNPGNDLVDLPENPALYPWIVDGRVGWWSKGQIGGTGAFGIDTPHRNGSNIAFYDGHVAWASSNDLARVLFDDWRSLLDY